MVFDNGTSATAAANRSSVRAGERPTMVFDFTDWTAQENAALRVRAGERPAMVFDRALFDRMDQSLNKGNGSKTGTGGTLAWEESYIMLGYLEMYRATRDRYYLDKLVDRDDMGRFARTFLKNIVHEDKQTTSNRVDGQGGYGAHNAVIGGWCDLAAWEPRVADAIRRICAEQKVHERSTGAALWTVARLVKWTSSPSSSPGP